MLHSLSFASHNDVTLPIGTELTTENFREIHSEVFRQLFWMLGADLEQLDAAIEHTIEEVDEIYATNNRPLQLAYAQEYAIPTPQRRANDAIDQLINLCNDSSHPEQAFQLRKLGRGELFLRTMILLSLYDTETE